MPAKDPSEANSFRDRLRSPIGMTIIRSIATIAIGLVLTILLPTRFTEEIGAQRMAKMVAPFEGYFYELARRHLLRKPDERPKIAIVTIDQNSLDPPPHGAGDGSWPAPYRYYAALLDALRSAGAKTVFLDVVLSHTQQKAEFDTLKTSVDAFNAQSGGSGEQPHVFLAAQRDCHNALKINPDIDALKGATAVGIEFSPNEVDRIAWTYPLVYIPSFAKEHEDQAGQAERPVSTDSGSDSKAKGNCSSEDKESDKELPRSAAAAMYLALPNAKPLDLQDEKARSIGVTWGMDTASDGLPWREENDEEKHARSESAFWHIDAREPDDDMYCTSSDHMPVLLLRAEARAWYRSLSRPLCVFHPTYPASIILPMDPTDSVKLFKDRIVLIGTSLRYSNDIVTSPLHDRIPGVFLHAMALDNLIHYNGEPPKNWEPSTNIVEAWHNGYLKLAALGVISIFLIRAAKDAVRKHTRGTFLGRDERREKLFSGRWATTKLKVAAFNFLWYFISGLILIVFAIVFLLIGRHAMGLPYLVVAHLIACSLAVEWLEWGEKFADWLMDWHEEKKHENPAT